MDLKTNTLFWLVCFCSLSIPNVAADNQPTVCQEVSSLIEQIKKEHVEAYNDSLWASHFLLELVRILDPEKQIFTKKDIAGLLAFRDHLNERSLKINCLIFDHISHLFYGRLRDQSAHFEVLAGGKPPYNPHVFVSPLLQESLEFADDIQQLKERWGIDFTEQVIQLSFEIDSTFKASTLKDGQSSFELGIAEKIKKRKLFQIEAIESDSSYLRNAFLQATSLAFDPHTEFFSKGTIKNFIEALDKTEESFGLKFSENRLGEIIVSWVVPAGPAWKSNLIHNGDRLVNFQVGEDDLMNASDFAAEEINRILIEGPKTVSLTLKRPDGQIFELRLTKEKLENTENVISSYLLDGERRIGYISLPAFYTNSEDEFEKGCANDVAMEIIKLKREKIDALILDLRFNGGGSMSEAIELGGIFIDFGPLALVQFSDQRIVPLKDFNKGVVYDGPLILMVNGASASASELLASTLRDYNRAVIVGSSTFGKATGQSIFQFGPQNSNFEDSEFVKITVEKVYNLHGQSHQGSGITPDVDIPDFMDGLLAHESLYANALVNLPIAKKVLYTPLKQLPIDEIKSKSRLRVQKSKNFKHIGTITKLIKEQVELTPSSYSEQVHTFNKLLAEINHQNESAPYEVTQNIFESDILLISDYQKEITNAHIQEIQNSFYIAEAYEIAVDLIEHLKK